MTTEPHRTELNTDYGTAVLGVRVFMEARLAGQ